AFGEGAAAATDLLARLSTDICFGCALLHSIEEIDADAGEVSARKLQDATCIILAQLAEDRDFALACKLGKDLRIQARDSNRLERRRLALSETRAPGI